MNETLSPPSPVLCLPAELTIYTVGEIHPQWLAWLATNDPEAELACEAVEQVDAAGLQLLLALARAVADKGRNLALRKPSSALRDACQALGLQAWLDEHSTPVAA